MYNASVVQKRGSFSICIWPEITIEEFADFGIIRGTELNCELTFDPTSRTEYQSSCRSHKIGIDFWAGYKRLIGYD